jgi:hypothetical protein
MKMMDSEEEEEEGNRVLNIFNLLLRHISGI